jgi:hypothetical protein
MINHSLCAVAISYGHIVLNVLHKNKFTQFWILYSHGDDYEEWVVTWCSSETAWLFGGTYCLLLQGLSVNQASAYFFVWLNLQSRILGWYDPLKRRAVSEVHGVTTQKCIKKWYLYLWVQCINLIIKENLKWLKNIMDCCHTIRLQTEPRLHRV